MLNNYEFPNEFLQKIPEHMQENIALQYYRRVQLTYVNAFELFISIEVRHCHTLFWVNVEWGVVKRSIIRGDVSEYLYRQCVFLS